MSMRSGGLWRTAYNVDFTTLSNLNIKTGGNGNKTIDGKTWLWGNDANCASADVVNGTGIVIVANAVNTGFYEGANVRTAPNLTVPVQTLFPLYDVGQTAFRVMLRVILTGADANVEGTKLFVEDSTTPEGQGISLVKWFTAGAINYRVAEQLNPAFPVIYPDNTTANATDDILSIIFWPPNGYETYTGQYVAGEKMRISTKRASDWQNIASPLMRLDTSPRIGFCQVTNNVTASLTTTFTHMRVDWHDRHPAL